jgi:hypothetical protein
VPKMGVGDQPDFSHFETSSLKQAYGLIQEIIIIFGNDLDGFDESGNG